MGNTQPGQQQQQPQGQHQYQQQQHQQAAVVQDIHVLRTKVEGMTAKARKNPNAALNDVEARYIKIDDAEKKEMVAKIDKFVRSKVMDSLKEESAVFKELYRTLYFTGSYYDGLRVSDAKEFDLNVVLAYPKAATHLRLEFDQKSPGFALVSVGNDLPVQLTREAKTEAEFRKHFLHVSGSKIYLSRDKPLRYMESLLTKILPGIEREAAHFGVRSVKFIKSGPAMNLKVTTTSGEVIDVDLVLAFVFPLSMIEGEAKINKELKRNPEFYRAKDEFFLIPKKPKGGTMSDHAWRLDFHDYEKRILNDMGCIKPVVRLLKLLRDRNEPLWNLSSYALKTVAMQIRRENVADKWEKKNIATKFLEVLTRLQTYLTSGSIPYVFDSRCNVLWNMSPAEKDIKANWLKRQLPKLEAAVGEEDCYKVWMGYFCVKSDMDELSRALNGVKL